MSNKKSCGCCGCEMKEELFCKRCEKHVLSRHSHNPDYERTYYAQYDKKCPYQLHGSNTPPLRPRPNVVPVGQGKPKRPESEVI